MTKVHKYQLGVAAYVMLFWAGVFLLVCGCGTTSTKTKIEHGDNVFVKGYIGGFSPKIGPYLGQARIEVTPGDSTSVRYTEEITTSVFNSGSQDVTRSFLFMTPSTNGVSEIIGALNTLFLISAGSPTNRIAR